MYKPDQSLKLSAIHYFTANQGKFPGVAKALEAFYKNPSLDTARAVMKPYFKGHEQGDIEALEHIAAAFADKRLALAITDSIIEDDDALDYIASRSYPHPIGFDKLVLFHDPDTNFKFRLHVYWRGNDRLAMERTHLHRFEMASAIISGELTNHLWNVTSYESDSDSNIVPKMNIHPQTSQDTEKFYAYSGYWRDENGVLHKKYLGNGEIERGSSETYVSGQSYAQHLADGHYVETNAETGLSNGDVCSTIYIHSGGLEDDEGRSIPILFEGKELDNPDEIIESIPHMNKQQLKEKLTRYKSFLENQLEFYDWLYDEKHGRNLSTGMIAGYLLAERYNNPHMLSVWIEHEDDCKNILSACSKTIASLVKGDVTLEELFGDDPNNRGQRYYAMLLDKANTHPKGKDYWLEHYGDLVKEMWRYAGALKGEKPEVTTLKPIWQDAIGKRLPGGAHYGHVAAMLEATYTVQSEVLKAFNAGVKMNFKSNSTTDPITEIDRATEVRIRDVLAHYYPDYSFYGEETGDSSAKKPEEDDKRWVVDPIDGTRNFANGLDDFSISLACQEYKNGGWQTTDAVIAMPSTGKIYWAEKSQGAYCIESNDLENLIERPDIDTLPETMNYAILNCSIRGFGKNAQKDMMSYIIDNDLSYRVSGSAATMLCYAAENDNHVAMVTANDYDVAAGLLIAEEAGAQLKTYSFRRDGHDFTAYLTGRNPALFNEVAAKVANVLDIKTAKTKTAQQLPKLQ